MKRFTLPRDMYYGKDSLSVLKELEGSKAVVVTGGNSMKRFGFLDQVVDYLETAGMEVKIIDGVEPDPSVETVLSGAKAMEEFGPDWIVAIGGGSPIDAAKAMWAFYEHPEVTFEELIIPFNFPKLRQKANFIAIPSTSGTAAEITAFSVITDYSKGIKYPLADFEITPDMAILDPAIPMTMPDWLAAQTGMDALAHALEAYVATEATEFTDALAMKAIEMIVEYLEDAVNGDETAREKLHYAQAMAGQSFTNALLGIVHSIAHKTGAAFEDNSIAHGHANALYLPYVIRFNRKDKTALTKYADIATRLGLKGDTELELSEALIGVVTDFNEVFEIENSLKEYGIPEEEYQQKRENIAREAVGDACTGSNPRSTSEEEMLKILDAIYYGKEVDF